MNIHILKKYCNTHMLTSRILARDLGITEVHVYNIWGYKSKPSLKLAKKIEEYTHGEVKAIDLLYPKNDCDE